MGARGPIPKSSESRRRRNATERPVVKIEHPSQGKPRPASSAWGSVAKSHYRDFRQSPQSRFYVQSDWAMLWLLCNELDHYVKGLKRNGQILTALLSGFSSLLATEGDRRRLQIELTTGRDEESGESEGEREARAWVTTLMPRG